MSSELLWRSRASRVEGGSVERAVASPRVDPLLSRPMSDSEELGAIGACIDTYCEAMRRGSAALVEEAFHEDARIAGPDDGALAQMSRGDFAELVADKGPHPDLDERILGVSVDGGVATARVADSYLGRRFIDHLALVKLEGRWRIYTKLWHVERRL